MVRTVLIVILVLIIISGIGFGYFLLYQEKEQAVMLSKELEMNLDTARKESEVLKAELEGVIEQINATNNENQKMSKVVNELNDSLKNTDFEVEMMTKERDILLKRLESQNQKINEFKYKIAVLEEEVVNAKAIAVEVSDVIDEGVKLEDIKLENIRVNEETSAVVKENIATVVSAEFSAQIMAFNKEYKFIVINRGEKDGIILDVNYILIIQGNQVGRIRPDRVYESMSVFDILEGAENISDGLEVELVVE
ncbi:MAG: hypothetical protein P9M06_03505 [Candidatus Saelkia tenebricola]|nr:hypothetical protein [Candidatus Saelkia tenebricola]